MPIRTKAEAIGKLDEAKSLIARVEEQLAIGARSPAQFTFLQDAPENDFLPRALSQIKEVRDYLDAEERRGGIRQGPDLIV